MHQLERGSKAEINAYQDAALRELLAYIAQNSPFYQRHFLEHGVDVAMVQSVQELSAIPVTTKDDLQRYNWDFLCVERGRIAEYSSTSGTLGEPVIIGLTKKDLTRLYYNEYQSFVCADSSADDIFQLMLTLDRQFMAGIAYYGGLLQLGAGIIRVGPGNIASQISNIFKLKPTALVAVPSFINTLVGYAKAQRINLNDTSVKRIICIGESIRQEDLQPNALAQKITASWQVKLYSTYASTEKQTAFTECGRGVGGHHQPELIIFEILDEEGRALPAGTPGELVITTLKVEGMPLLRYKTGDICAYYDEPCACGRTTKRLGPIIGRKQQLIKYKGTTVYPQAIFNCLNSFAAVSGYVVEVFRSEIGTDELKINLALHQSFSEELLQIIQQTMQSQLRVLPTVQLLPLQQLHALQQADGKRKPSIFIDRR